MHVIPLRLRKQDFHHWCGNGASDAQVAASYEREQLSQAREGIVAKTSVGASWSGHSEPDEKRVFTAS